MKNDIKVMLFKNLTTISGADFSITADNVVCHNGYPKDRDVIVQVLVPEGQRATEKQLETAETLCCHLLDYYGCPDGSLVMIGDDGHAV